jgi:hypothetical protein
VSRFFFSYFALTFIPFPSLPRLTLHMGVSRGYAPGVCTYVPELVSARLGCFSRSVPRGPVQLRHVSKPSWFGASLKKTLEFSGFSTLDGSCDARAWDAFVRVGSVVGIRVWTFQGRRRKELRLQPSIYFLVISFVLACLRVGLLGCVWTRGSMQLRHFFLHWGASSIVNTWSFVALRGSLQLRHFFLHWGASSVINTSCTAFSSLAVRGLERTEGLVLGVFWLLSPVWLVR